MVLREMMLDSLQIMPLPAKASSFAAKKADGVKQSFGDVLKSAVKTNEKSEGIPDEPTTAPRQKTGNDTPESKHVKTFREVNNEARQKAVKCETVSKEQPAVYETAADKSPEEEKDINNGTLERIINCFAQALGINPGEFRQLMKAADISAEELAASSDVSRLTAKLSEVLGLNAEQSKTLGDMLEMVKTSVQETLKPGEIKQLLDAFKQEKAVNGIEASPVEGMEDPPAIEVVRAPDNPESEFSALMVKLKLKLNELKEKLNNGNEVLVEEVSQKVKEVLKETDGAQEMKAKTLTAETEDVIGTKEVENAPVKSDDKQNDANLKEDAGEKKTVADTVKTAPEAAATAVNDDQPQVVVPAAVQVQKAVGTVQLERLDARTPVQTREIINQVLEKAKVVLTGDKSEMVMDLKPDSLGKLSLKVVTEHGIVMAKFVAENQQVKQVLETNMQLLKDSLEKQGMSVQGFSVSVRQDSQQGYRGRSETASSGKASLQRMIPRTEGPLILPERFQAMEMKNPYILGTNTVSFTA